MKNEAEIRRHRDALAIARAQPCNCPKEGHEMECHIGGMNMASAEAALTWVLGEATQRYETNVVANVNAEAAKHHPARN